MTTQANHPEVPVGELFTRAYMERGPLVHESNSLRRRLGAYVQHDLFKDHWDLSVYLEKECGFGPEQFAGQNSLYHRYEQFFLNLSRDDLLNVITLVWRFLFAKHQQWQAAAGKELTLVSKPADAWRIFVSRTLREENVGYSLDNRCGVHYAIDGI